MSCFKSKGRPCVWDDKNAFITDKNIERIHRLRRATHPRGYCLRMSLNAHVIRILIVVRQIVHYWIEPSFSTVFHDNVKKRFLVNSFVFHLVQGADSCRPCFIAHNEIRLKAAKCSIVLCTLNIFIFSN